MPRINRQQFRNEGRTRKRTISLIDVEGRNVWLRDDSHLSSSDPALEAAMRPFLDELTFPQLEAVQLVYFQQLSERQAAEELGIHQRSLQERLAGARRKLRDLIVEAVGSENYGDIRRWLTPSQKITKSGHKVLYETARCVECGTPLAQYRANALGLSSKLRCPEHAGLGQKTLPSHATAIDGSVQQRPLEATGGDDAPGRVVIFEEE